MKIIDALGYTIQDTEDPNVPRKWKTITISTYGGVFITLVKKLKNNNYEIITPIKTYTYDNGAIVKLFITGHCVRQNCNA